MPEQKVLDYYLEQGPLARGAAAELPRVQSVGEAAGLLHNLILHEHMASGYGVALTEGRRAEVHTRELSGMLAAASALRPGPLTEERPPECRWIGNCRHFSLVAVAMLRRAGIPARARCGFAMYFDHGKGVDHWVAEYWDAARAIWVLADAQIDDMQKRWFQPDFDVLDVPRDRFLVAGEAWRLCREGKADPQKFGIMQEAGLWFIAGNVIRDAAALNGFEMLPWDTWGAMPEPTDTWTDEEPFFDRLADLTSDPDRNFEELQRVYQSDERVRVPGRVLNVLLQREEPVFADRPSGPVS